MFQVSPSLSLYLVKIRLGDSFVKRVESPVISPSSGKAVLRGPKETPRFLRTKGLSVGLVPHSECEFENYREEGWKQGVSLLKNNLYWSENRNWPVGYASGNDNDFSSVCRSGSLTIDEGVAVTSSGRMPPIPSSRHTENVER